MAEIYPVPAYDILNLNINGTSKFRSLKIYNVNGKEVLNQIIEEKLVRIDLSGIKNGIYFLVLEDYTNNLFSRKVQVTR